MSALSPRLSSLGAAALVGAGCLLLQGCGIPFFRQGVAAVPVREVDSRAPSLARVRQLKGGDTEETVIAVLGEPADRKETCVPGLVAWRYPVRAWNDTHDGAEVAPAVLLRTRFDATGTLDDWGFVDPVDGRPLAVRETSADASRWFRKLALAPPPHPPRVELREVLITGKTTRDDVERILGAWQPDLHCGRGGPVPVVRKASADAGSVLDWFVDRPSPFFVPPRYLVASFDEKGLLISWYFQQTYPGGEE